ncbi:MAG TPA: hypothetical protein VFF68_13680 [Anaerolineaceae bacterium]|nr:hypothetical protein [Anaerolineaceae bacterium]
MNRVSLGRLGLGLIILVSSLFGSSPAQANLSDEVGSTWFLPTDTQPVCVGQKVVIRGGYTLTGAVVPDPLEPLVPDPLAPLVGDQPDPLAPLTSTTILNETSLGTVSPRTINVYEDSGFFTFTFTATKPGVAQIRSDIPGLPSLAQLTLRVTDRCHYIYGVRADFTIDVHASGGGFATGDYYLWAGGYLKVKDPNRPGFLSNDPQDRVTLGGKLTAFQAGDCSSASPLAPKKARFQGEGLVDEDSPVVQVTFNKLAPFSASGSWSIVCPEVTVPVPDVYAQAMMMIDGAPTTEPFVTATCPADGGVCDAAFPALNFMSAMVSTGGGNMPVSIDVKLEKVR